MKSIEIPLKADRDWRYRFFEMLPGLTSWSIVFMPIILSFFSALWASYFVIMFMLAWLVKALGYAIRTTQGYNRLQNQMKLSWRDLLSDLEEPQTSVSKWHERVS